MRRDTSSGWIEQGFIEKRAKVVGRSSRNGLWYLVIGSNDAEGSWVVGYGTRNGLSYLVIRSNDVNKKLLTLKRRLT